MTEPRTAAETLVDALYDDRCIEPPQTDHAEHVITALLRAGYGIVRRAEAATPAASGDALREALSLARAIRSGKWYREAKKSLGKGIYPTWAQIIALVDRLAASPPLPEGLDVERLSHAIMDHAHKTNSPGCDWHCAPLIAAEYARLAAAEDSSE